MRASNQLQLVCKILSVTQTLEDSGLWPSEYADGARNLKRCPASFILTANQGLVLALLDNWTMEALKELQRRAI